MMSAHSKPVVLRLAQDDHGEPVESSLDKLRLNTLHVAFSHKLH